MDPVQPNRLSFALDGQVTLVPMDVVRCSRRITSKRALALVASGQLRYVFHFGIAGSQRRDLHFWATELARETNTSSLTIDEVIRDIIPPALTSFRLRDIKVRFCLSKTTTLRMASLLGRRNKRGHWRISRKRLVKFLHERWLGSNAPGSPAGTRTPQFQSTSQAGQFKQGLNGKLLEVA